MLHSADFVRWVLTVCVAGDREDRYAAGDLRALGTAAHPVAGSLSENLFHENMRGSIRDGV